MQSLIEALEEQVKKAFAEAGYDASYGRVGVSNRPDLCEYQCNGAMPLAKQVREKPIDIAQKVAGYLADATAFSAAEAVMPGFINLTLSEGFVASYVSELREDASLGMQRFLEGETIVLDYGGPNIAKPLHVGHLRSAVIGESMKRILRFAGARVIGDIHMGDWGLPIGLVARELSARHPDWAYFDASHEGGFPKEAPFTVSELEEVYPAASAKSKEDADYRADAMEMTRRLQQGDKGLRALWHAIMEISKADLKKVYDWLHVTFDLWKGEADVDADIAPMIEELKRDGIAHESDGALVIDVRLDDDKKEIPPCIILKSDGASLYATTDLATIRQRMALHRPDRMVYLTDKRQEMHFVQVFRAARKARFVFPETELVHIGFGTVNGKDGKPYKTRDGGVPRLEHLLDEIRDAMVQRIRESDRGLGEEESARVAEQVSVAALKYADLSNQPAKDYIFDPEKFTAFEGDTGPYLLYTMVRIKSILARYAEEGGDPESARIVPADTAAHKALQLALCAFPETVAHCAKEYSAHGLCAYLFGLSNALNTFYHDTKILTEEDPVKKEGYIALIGLVLRVLAQGIDLLGFSAPERM
ncbi:MAG: arginine--tRNA ligase [Lachnospiraceae bacterium]|nr:arginine--tRNA ligase [Lachnospiraceae bacterium]